MHVCGWNHFFFYAAWLCGKWAIHPGSTLKWPTDQPFHLSATEGTLVISLSSRHLKRKLIKMWVDSIYILTPVYKPAVMACPILRCHITVKHPNLLERALRFNSYALPPHSPEHLSIIHIIMWDSHCPTLTREKNQPGQWTLFWSVRDVVIQSFSVVFLFRLDMVRSITCILNVLKLGAGSVKWKRPCEWGE